MICTGDSCRKANAGFTLVELAIVVTVVAILAVIAGSAFWNYVLETRIAGETNYFAVSLYQARTDALTLSAPVSVCPSNDSATCDGAAWQDGWIVFTDNGAPGQVDANDAVLRTGKPMDSQLDLSIDSVATYVRFVPSDLRFAK